MRLESQDNIPPLHSQWPERSKEILMHRLFLISTIVLSATFVSCAPTASAAGEPVILTPAQQQEICNADPRIGEDGMLIWGGEGDANSLSAPFAVTCPTVALASNGREVTVQASTLNGAIDVFTPSAFLLAYYADLRVRVTDTGILTADDPNEAPEALMDDVRGIEVIVTPQGGDAHRLVSRGTVTPYRFDARVPFTLTFRTGRAANPWPTVVMNPATGTVLAVKGR